MPIKYDRPAFHYDEEKKEYTKPEPLNCGHGVEVTSGDGLVWCARCSKKLGRSDGFNVTYFSDPGLQEDPPTYLTA